MPCQEIQKHSGRHSVIRRPETISNYGDGSPKNNPRPQRDPLPPFQQPWTLACIALTAAQERHPVLESVPPERPHKTPTTTPLSHHCRTAGQPVRLKRLFGQFGIRQAQVVRALPHPSGTSSSTINRTNSSTPRRTTISAPSLLASSTCCSFRVGSPSSILPDA